MRRVGQLLIGLALAGAVIGGLLLAVRAGEGGLAAAGSLAGVLFIAVTGAAAAGIYLYVRGEPDDGPQGPHTETHLARRLSEALGGGDRLSFAALADALGTDAEAVARLLSELARLGVLPAAISWDSATIYPRNRGYLTDVTACLHCGEPLPATDKPSACVVCGTIHYDV